MTNYKKHRKKIKQTFLLALLTLIFGLPMINSAHASSTQVSIDYYGEPSIIDPTMVPGTTFTMNVTVDYIEYLAGFQFELGRSAFWDVDPEKYRGWDSSILHLLAVDLGPFLGSRGGTVLWFPGDINNTQGTLDLSMAILDPLRRFPTGGGTLASLTFQVVGVGSTPIRFSGDTALINRTGGYEFNGVPMKGTLNPEFLVHGYFDNRLMSADLVRRSAWPEHHHYSISKDEDGKQTLFGKVRNLETTDVYVKVVFNITKVGGSSQIVETPPSTDLIATGQIIDLTFDFGPFTNEDVGKYIVTAKCWYSSDGNYWMQGEKTKRFSFSIVP